MEEAYKIEEHNGKDYGRQAIEKEMSQVRIAFEKRVGGTTKEEVKKWLVRYQEVRCHMIFNVKMSGLVRKVSLVAGGHTTDTPSSITYSSVVSRDSVRIVFLVAALNDLDIMSVDIGNAYLNAPNKEKIWMIAGHEFGTDKGAVFIITQTLYGLKSAGAEWRTFFAQALTRLEFKPTWGNRDVYIKPQIKPNGDRYYEMILVYVDDILIISHNTKPIIDSIASQFQLKEDSLHAPNEYLGTTIKIYTENSGLLGHVLGRICESCSHGCCGGLGKAGAQVERQSLLPIQGRLLPRDGHDARVG